MNHTPYSNFQERNANNRFFKQNTKINQILSKAGFFLTLLFLLASSGQAAVTVDRASSNRASNPIGLNSITWSHTVGTGTETALYVGVSTSTTLLPVSVAPSLLSVGSVTYNGLPMTRVGSVQSPGIETLGLVSKSYVEVFRLINPPAGAHSVVVNFSLLGVVPITPFVNFAVGGAVSYNGVSQTAPNGTFSRAAGFGTAPSVVVNGSTTQDLVMDVLASSPNAENFTPGSGQALRWRGDFPAPSIFDGPFDIGAGSTATGGSPVTTSWTLEDDNGWALGGLAIRAASNPPSVITVNSLADNETNGCAVGNCTLREAIADANSTPQPDTIVFASGVRGNISLLNGQLPITSDLTIVGPGARSLSVSGGNLSRVFLVATPLLGGDFTANISGLTITGGNATPALIGSTLIGDGGGILNGALLGVLSGTPTLNLTEVSVVNNATTTLGGGVATRLGAITNISRSQISGNSSNPVTQPILDDGSVGGGGISNAAFSTTNVFNSTISNNNSLAVAGGILNAAGTVNLVNGTISNNTSTLAGGGVVSLLGVIPPVLGVTTLRNTIIAKNNDLLAFNIVGRDVVGVLGSFDSLGNNLIGSNFGAEADLTASAFVGTIPQLNPELDLVGNASIGNQIIDPLLGALQNNGGLTNTRAITPLSPAFNMGNNCVVSNNCSSNPNVGNPLAVLTTDQRGTGFLRLAGAAVDIGAFEVQFAPTAGEVSISGRVTAGRKGILRAVVTLTGSDGAVQTQLTDRTGNYRFDDVAAGETYVIQVNVKFYAFAPRVISVNEEVQNLDFVADDENFLSTRSSLSGKNLKSIKRNGENENEKQ